MGQQFGLGLAGWFICWFHFQSVSWLQVSGSLPEAGWSKMVSLTSLEVSVCYQQGKPTVIPCDFSSSSMLLWAASPGVLREAREGRPQCASVYITFAIDLLVKVNHTAKPRGKGVKK